MSECYLNQCQQDRKFIRREFGKWTKNILLQIGLETISKYHCHHDIEIFSQTIEKHVPSDFNPSKICLFCINREEYYADQRFLHNTYFNNEDNVLMNFNSNLYASYFPLIYQLEGLTSLNCTNSDYLSKSWPNNNHFASTYQTDLSVSEKHIAQLAKRMAYTKMIEEIEYQRDNTKIKIFHQSSSFSSQWINVSHVLDGIMRKILNEIVENRQDINNVYVNTNDEYKNSNVLNRSISSSSSIRTKNEAVSKSNRKRVEMIVKSKTIVDIHGKKMRSKRGNYRRYKSEQLSKAMTAVLNNHFSEPHSTFSTTALTCHSFRHQSSI
ncbi:hypothetical protein I4U23_008066 [Adineta vaga]|nr:hypothetical protein I4U23_008066 [Adineta vaga]